MKFRPCIDIHNGKIKQIIGSSLKDEDDHADDNFVSEKNGDYYSGLYAEAGLTGGHIILLNAKDSPYYEEDVKQACLALRRAPGTLQIGGGITDENAAFFLEQGATHVIVTSFVFQNGKMNMEHLKRLLLSVGKERIVLDLSCRWKDGNYYIVTDRWQKFTDIPLNTEVLDRLAGFCDEFLIHAVDVEGKTSGIDKELVKMLGQWDGIPITYAGGVSSYEDLECLRTLGQRRLDVTIGSALDLFGGHLKLENVLAYCDEFV